MGDLYPGHLLAKLDEIGRQFPDALELFDHQCPRHAASATQLKIIPTYTASYQPAPPKLIAITEAATELERWRISRWWKADNPNDPTLTYHMVATWHPHALVWVRRSVQLARYGRGTARNYSGEAWVMAPPGTTGGKRASGSKGGRVRERVAAFFESINRGRAAYELEAWDCYV